MARLGIIATQEGVDIKNAPDYKRVLDSDWPLLEIAFEKIYTSDLTTGLGTADRLYTFPILTHNLGFAPAFTWMDSQGFDPFSSGYSANDPHSFRYNIEANSTSIYITLNVPAAFTPLDFTVRGKLIVYGYDPTKDFAAISVGSSDAGMSKGAVGMIALKDGSLGNINDTEYSRFSTHTKAKSLQIHKSGVMTIDEASSGAGVITHNLGYLPSYMIFSIKDSGALVPGIAARTSGDDKKLGFNGVQSALLGKWAYIIFKDPLLEQV